MAHGDFSQPHGDHAWPTGTSHSPMETMHGPWGRLTTPWRLYTSRVDLAQPMGTLHTPMETLHSPWGACMARGDLAEPTGTVHESACDRTPALLQPKRRVRAGFLQLLLQFCGAEPSSGHPWPGLAHLRTECRGLCRGWVGAPGFEHGKVTVVGGTIWGFWGANLAQGTLGAIAGWGRARTGPNVWQAPGVTRPGHG